MVPNLQVSKVRPENKPSLEWVTQAVRSLGHDHTPTHRAGEHHDLHDLHVVRTTRSLRGQASSQSGG